MATQVVRTAKAVAVCVVAPCVVWLTLLTHAQITAHGIAEDMEMIFIASGQDSVDRYCERVLYRRGLFATCYPAFFSDGENVTLKRFVTVFPTRQMAERDRKDKLNGGAVGAVVNFAEFSRSRR